MAIKSPKQKGAGGELEVCRLLTSWAASVGVQLQLERNLEQVRYGGADINGVPGLEIEVKRVEANGINQWWSQVCTAARKTGKRPMLCHRKNRQPWSFRIGASVYEVAPATGAAVLIPIAIDLELAQAKVWFQNYILQQHKEKD